MNEGFRVVPRVTGFEFLTDGRQTTLFLKTLAGDLRGVFVTADPLDAAIIVLLAGDSDRELLEAMLAQDRPSAAATAVYGLRLRDPGHPLEAIHDALAAARFFDDFGVDRLAFVGSGVAGAAALAAGSSLSTCRAAAGYGVAQMPGLVGGQGRPQVLLDADPGPDLAWLTAIRPVEIAGAAFLDRLQGWLLAALRPD